MFATKKCAGPYLSRENGVNFPDESQPEGLVVKWVADGFFLCDFGFCLYFCDFNLYLFIFQFFKRLLDNLIVFLQSLHFWVHFSDVLFQTIRQLHLENRAACNVVCHTLQRLLHAVQDIILKLELLGVLLVLFLEAWVVLLVRLEFWLLKDSSPHLITLPERHRDVIRILIRVLIVAVSAFALALRIRCHIQVTDPSTQHLTLIFVRSIGTSVFGVHMRQFLIAITATATVLL